MDIPEWAERRKDECYINGDWYCYLAFRTEDIFAEAQFLASICTKCNGTGWYKYDENHATVCNKCCKHDQGWWELTPYHSGYINGANNLCCKAGCGTMYRDLKGNDNE